MTERGPEGHAPRSGARTWAGLDQVPVEELAGVGERRGKALEALGIRSVTDLLTHYPRRYLDRTRQASLAELAVGEEATVLATVRKVGSRRTRNRRSLVEVDCFDGTGYLRATFFNQPWRSRQLAAGTEAVFFGKLETYQGRRRMTNPVVDLVGDRTGRIVPVYPSSEKAGVSTWELAGLVEEALRRAGDLVDPLPESWRGRLRLPSRTDALRAVHAPTSLEEAEEGRRRLALDELLRLQVALVGRKRAVERDTAGVSHLVDDAPEGLLGRFRATLPFALTGAQRRAVDAIRDDMARPVPMHRLLQGDVGAGKTLVALSAMLVAVQGGHQAALMAPTEVLAEQHHMGLTALLAQLEVPDPSRLGGVRPLRTALLSGRTAASERARLLADMAGGQVDIVVGTHA
ncbi:MAG: DEAD/DEAH box helicase, partial [Acidimicrobiales bacterium]